jgi:hypothetical protein
MEPQPNSWQQSLTICLIPYSLSYSTILPDRDKHNTSLALIKGPILQLLVT